MRSFQLVVGQAHRAQERIPARVILKIRQERIFAQTGQARVALPARTLQPFESLILVPAIRVNLGDLVCRRFGKILGQLRERGV